DAIRACTVITRVVADAIQEGQYLAYQRMQRGAAEREFEREPAAPVPSEAVEEPEATRVTLSAEEAAWMGIGVEERAGAAGQTEAEAAGEPEAGLIAETGAQPAAPVAQAVSLDEEPGVGPAGAPALPAEELATDVSARWAAPRDAREEEARTVPDLAGPGGAGGRGGGNGLRCAAGS